MDSGIHNDFDLNTYGFEAPVSVSLLRAPQDSGSTRRAASCGHVLTTTDLPVILDSIMLIRHISFPLYSLGYLAVYKCEI